MREVGDRRRAGLAVWRWWALVAVAFALLLGTWALGTPLGAAPDEMGHTTKAFAAAHGELLGDAVAGRSPLNRDMHAPADLVSALDTACFSFFPETPASCTIADPSPAVIAVESNVSAYPPLWYAVIGGLTRMVGRAHSGRAYRLGSLLVATALLAWAASLLARSGRRRAVLLLLGLPPMAVYMSMAANPTSFEIAGMLVLWSTAAWWLAAPAPPRLRQWLVASTAAAVIVLARPVSITWVAVAVAAYLLLERRPLGPPRWSGIALGAAPMAVAVVASAAWSRYAAIGLADDKFVLPGSTIDHLRTSFGHTSEMFVQTVGVLGWLDVRLPAAVIAIGTVFVVAIALAALVHGDRRMRLVVAGLAAVWVLYPMVYTTLARTPLNWQGRYNVPLLGGLVLLAAELVRRGVLPRLVPRWPLFVGAGFVVMEVLALHQTLRRYMVGASGNILLREAAWHPLLNAWLLVVVNAALATATVVVLARGPAAARVSAPSSPRPSDEGSGDDEASVVRAGLVAP
ncbi:MAG: DUF2142 domain-containing protein [Ilumatobacteraceae bacterium]